MVRLGARSNSGVPQHLIGGEEAHQKSGSFPPPALPGLGRYYAPVRLPPVPPPVSAVETATLAHDGSPPLPASPFRRAVPTTPADRDGCACRLLPRSRGLPRYTGGSASASLLSRPAQASLTLRPVGLLRPPKAAFVTRLRPVASITADGDYDQENVYADVAERHPRRRSSCPRARRRCPAPRPRPRRRGATATCASSPRRAGWDGKKRRGTTLVPGRGVHLALQARDRRWAALAHRPASRGRGQRRRPRAQPYVGVRTPELRPHCLTPNGVGVTAPATPTHAPSVDAPLRARENFRTAVTRSRMLPSVRPAVRQRAASGLHGSSRIGSKSRRAYSRYGVAAWLSRSRLADRCAMPSFRSPYALATAARLRRHGRSPIHAAFDQQGPNSAGHLVGQGHGDQHPRLARQHPRQPRALRCAALVRPAHHRARAEDE